MKSDTDKIMAKVSGLEARFEAVLTKLNTIGTDIGLLKRQLGDADIPADAEATLERLEAAAQTDLDAATPETPTPSPGVPQPPTT